MKLYIWEGDGISDAYHDDGTLVVLAHTPREARALVRAARLDREAATRAMEDFWRRHQGERVADFDQDTRSEWDALSESYYRHANGWDGRDAALDRPPDRTIDVQTPCIVAFNGGGYD